MPKKRPSFAHQYLSQSINVDFLGTNTNNMFQIVDKYFAGFVLSNAYVYASGTNRDLLAAGADKSLTSARQHK
jgi:hypothetical protein